MDKHVFSLAFASFLALGGGLSSACSPREADANFPYVARIISSQEGIYKLSNVTLETLEDVRTLRGRIGELRGNASLNLNIDSSEIITSAHPDDIYENRGSQVQIDYLVKKGVIVPQNFQSMEMLGLYSNLERTIRYWEDNFGIDFEAIGYPGFLYNPKRTSKKSGITEEVAQVMNAAYIPGVRDLWFFKTSPRERVPVKMNFGVVAHEFGHFIFDYRFAGFDPSAYDIESANNERMLSGLNEGLADFFAYMVTGSPREFGNSLPSLAAERNLPVGWTASTLLESGCKGGYYCEGSLLASALFEISNAAGQTPLKVGALAYEALPLFAEAWQKFYKQELLDYRLYIEAFLSVSGDDKELYCSIIKKWFDTESYRAGISCF